MNDDTVLLEVESTFRITNRFSVIACKSIKGGFEYGPIGKDYLNNLPLAAQREWIIATDTEGNPRLDLFAFVLLHDEDICKFTKGQIVEYKVMP